MLKTNEMSYQVCSQTVFRYSPDYIKGRVESRGYWGYWTLILQELQVQTCRDVTRTIRRKNPVQLTAYTKHPVFVWQWGNEGLLSRVTSGLLLFWIHIFIHPKNSSPLKGSMMESWSALSGWHYNTYISDTLRQTFETLPTLDSCFDTNVSLWSVSASHTVSKMFDLWQLSLWREFRFSTSIALSNF